MKKVFIIFSIIFLYAACKKIDYSKYIVADCNNIYYYKEKDGFIYYYFLMNFENKYDKDMILKKNKFYKGKDDRISLELNLKAGNSFLESPFIESNIMETNYILYKGKESKVIYYLKGVRDEINFPYIVVYSYDHIIDTIYLNKNLIELQEEMDVEYAGKLMNAHFIP